MKRSLNLSKRFLTHPMHKVMVPLAQCHRFYTKSTIKEGYDAEYKHDLSNVPILSFEPAKKVICSAHQVEMTNIKYEAMDTFLTMSGQIGDQTWNAEFDYFWLRDHCSCHACFDVDSGQKMYRINKAPSDLQPIEVELTSEGLEIYWNDNHKSIYSPTFLYKHSTTLSEDRSMHTWKASDLNLKRFEFADYMSQDETLYSAMQAINKWGIAILQNANPSNKETVRKVVERMSYVRNSIYGETWEVAFDPKAINIAYSNVEIDYHQDLCYYEAPPGLQLLHCVEASQHGGESFFCDLFQIANDFEKAHPEFFKVLSNIPISFHNGAIESDHVAYYRTMFNVQQGKLLEIFYSPYWEGPFHFKSATESRTFYQAYRAWSTFVSKEEYRVEFLLKPGETVIFNNRRLGHARRTFDLKSKRHLQGIYCDLDEFANKYQKLRREYGGPPLAHLGNASHIDVPPNLDIAKIV